MCGCRIFALVFLIFVEAASAQTENSTPRAFECQYAEGFSWTDASGDFVGSRTSGIPSLTFVIDSPKRGRMIGNVGVADVAVIANAFGLTFLEITDLGNVITTSIFHDPQLPSGSWTSVHSRHINMIFGSVFSQSIGECKAKS